MYTLVFVSPIHLCLKTKNDRLMYQKIFAHHQGPINQRRCSVGCMDFFIMVNGQYGDSSQFIKSMSSQKF